MSEELLEFCDDCGKEFPIDKLTEKGLDFLCNECFVPTCRECDAPLEENVDFCSYQCHRQYWVDIMEDDYKNRD